MNSRPSSGAFLLLAAASALLIFAAYSNHFRNSFHFDDASVIQNNAYLRSLRNVPLFFRDATTFSSYTPNAAYRPLTSTSFALDYWWGGGLNPLHFHVTQFGWHLVMSLLVFLFLERVLALAGLEGQARRAAALGAAALFAVHRLNSQTVNFLTLRSEILAAVGVVGSFVLYQRAPRLRRSFLWLLPAVMGLFAKQSALVFAPLFAVYLLAFPEERAVTTSRPPTRWPWLALIAPAFLAAAAFYVLQARLAGAGLVYGSTPTRIYFQTQVFAWLHYMRLFLVPVGLSADADWSPIRDWYDTRVLVGGLVALAFLAASAWYARRRPAGRAVLFGAIWYYVALAPTSSFFPLSEMVNEHRPYLPSLGLLLVATAAGADVWTHLRSPRIRRGLAAAAVLLLAAHAAGTFVRNRDWRDEESLWRSVTQASPANGRAWMNYGLIFMARADYPNARFCFDRASTLVPNYDLLEINRGILAGATGNPVEAERHLRRAIELNSATATAHFYYGRWLHENGRDSEAADQLSFAIQINPADLDARRQLIRVHQKLGDGSLACSLARETLRIAPADEAAAAAARDCPPP